MNGLALAGSWRVSAELGAHCAREPQACETLAGDVRRVLLPGLLVQYALVGGHLGTGLALGRRLAARTPTAVLTCFATLLASGSSLATAQSAELAISNMLDEFGSLLGTLWAELFTSFFSSLATVLNWWLIADWIVLLYGCLQYLRGVRREREPEAFRAARTARDRVGRRATVRQRPVEEEDACAICLDGLSSDLALLEHCRFGCGKACHRRCLRQWLRFSDKCPNCTTLWQRPREGAAE